MCSMSQKNVLIDRYCWRKFVFISAFSLFSCHAIDAFADIPMSQSDPELYMFIARCAPTVHPETMAAVISTESRGKQFAIADAGPVNLPWSQRKNMVRSFYMSSLDEAVSKASSLISQGHTVSLGLAQVNDRNLKSLNLSLRQIFDPCVNVAAGGQILTGFYKKAYQHFGPGTKAMRAALSAYNSGSWIRGEQDGYVDLVYRRAGLSPSVHSNSSVVAKKQNSKNNTNSSLLVFNEKKEFALSSAFFGK